MTQPPPPLTMLLSRHTRRREFIAGLAGATAWPVAARAQAKVYAIGILETVPRAQNQASFAALLNGLRELGYVEGQNLRIDYRSADGQGERCAELASTGSYRGLE